MSIQQVNVDWTGQSSSQGISAAATSRDGRYVVFESSASDILGGADRGSEIYLRDMETGQTQLISRGLNGDSDNGMAGGVAISADGRYVVYSSWAGNLVEGDDNQLIDVFVFDRVTSTTRKISSSEVNNSRFDGAISSDGRYVAFYEDRYDSPSDRILVVDQITGETVYTSDSSPYVFKVDRITAVEWVGPTYDSIVWEGNATENGVFRYGQGLHVGVRQVDPNPGPAVFDLDTAGKNVGAARDPQYHGDGLWSWFPVPSENSDTGVGHAWLKDTRYTFDNSSGALVTRWPADSADIRIGKITVSDDGRFIAFTSNYDFQAQAFVDGWGLFIWDSSRASIVERPTLPGELPVAVVENIVIEVVTIADGAVEDPFYNLHLSGNGHRLLVSTSFGEENDQHNLFLVDNPLWNGTGGSEDSIPPPSDWLEGSAGADVLFGGGPGEHIDGLGGDDLLSGGGGADTITGGEGLDHIQGDGGADTLDGEEGADVIFGDHGAPQAAGDEGGDKLYGRGGDDELHGDQGDDFLYGGDGDDVLYGDDGRDVLEGGEGDDELNGGEGSDEFSPGGGLDLIDGGEDAAGDDIDIVILEGGPGDYTFTETYVGELGRWGTEVEAKDGSEHFIAVGVERAQFEHLPDDAAEFEDGAVTLAGLARVAIDEEPNLGSGWRPLSALELGIAVTEEREGARIQHHYFDGVYRGKDGDGAPSDGVEAAAQVYFGVVNGQNTLMVGLGTVGGSGEFPDLDWLYAKFQPVLEAVLSYVELDGYNTGGETVDRVLIAGHELGGSIAQMFLQDPRIMGDPRFGAITFGSPGAALHAPDSRIIHFEHSGDPLPLVGDIARGNGLVQIAAEWLELPSRFAEDASAYATAGTVIRVSTEGDDGGDAHGMTRYLETALRLAAYDDVLEDLGYSGGPGAHFEVVVGTDEAEVLEGASPLLTAILRGPSYWDGSEVFFSGDGADVIVGGLGSDTFAGTLDELLNDRIMDFGDGDRIYILGADPGLGITYTPNDNPLTGGVLRIGATVIVVDGWHPGVFAFEPGAHGAATFVYHGLIGLFGGGDDDDLAGGGGDDILEGGGGGDVIAGGAGADEIVGGAGADTLAGGSGDDVIYGDERAPGVASTALRGEDQAEGPAARAAAPLAPDDDVVLYDGARADYLVEAVGDGSTRVSDLRAGSPDGVDILWDVEVLTFADGTMRLDAAPGAAPVLAGLGSPAAFVEGVGAPSAAVAVAPDITVADADSATLASARVAITGGFRRGEDTLSFTSGPATGDIVASYDATTGVLTLTSAGGATPAQWQAALRSVAYGNSSEDPSTAGRTLSFSISDGGQTSAVATQTVTVAARNDAPDGTDATLRLRAGESRALTVADFGFRDVDGDHLAAVTITSLPSAGRLTLSGAAVTAGQVVSVADIQAGRLVFVVDAAAATGAFASFGFAVQDDGGTAGGGVDRDAQANTLTVEVGTPAPDPNPNPGPSPTSQANGSSGDDRLVLGDTPQVFSALEGDDQVRGGAGGDFIHGNQGQDTVAGGAGADTLHGGRGDDSLEGGDGDDMLSGGLGDDTILGGLGNDVIAGGEGRGYLRGGAGDDVVWGGSGFDDAHGNQGDDILHGGAGDDWVVGGQDQDLLFGDDGADIVLGNLGDDSLDGGAGADQLRGGQGDDSIFGGAGDDFLAGDRGADTLTGGAGADMFHTFAEAGRDVVTDFNAAEGDRVQLLPGAGYTVRQVGGDVEIALDGGAELILQGVRLDALPPGWII